MGSGSTSNKNSHKTNKDKMDIKKYWQNTNFYGT